MHLMLLQDSSSEMVADVPIWLITMHVWPMINMYKNIQENSAY